MRRRGGKVQNPGGEPLGFIGATNARRATARLGLRAYHDTPPRDVAGYVPMIHILSHKNHTGCFPFPGRPGLFSHRGDMGQKAFLHPTWAQEFKGRPNSLDGRPNEGWAHKRPELRHTSLKGTSMRNQVPTRLTLDESPRMGYHGFL